MNKRGVKMPVILGGAALTRRFVEEDLRSLYEGYVFYGEDAFTGLRIMDELTNPAVEKKLTLIESRGGSGQTNKPIEPAKEPSVFMPVKANVPIPRPPFWGSRVARGVQLKEVFDYINETALLKVRWGFSRGKTSAEEYQKLLKEKVEPLFQKWKDHCLKQQLLVPQVVYGYFPCQSNGDTVIIYRPEDLKKEWVRFTFPRQRDTPQRCISDFFLPSPRTLSLQGEGGRRPGEGLFDVFACSIVTVGTQASRKEQDLFKKNSYTDYLYLHGLSVETAEALAELWHRRMREELGISGDDSPNIRDWFHQAYHGGRYSFGYPACPNLEDQKQLFELLDPSRIQVSLSEEFQLVPEQSTSAIVVHHSDAKYFNVQ
jgi:5-methyltetrahydrofolate--homocysteine methyltransferase